MNRRTRVQRSRPPAVFWIIFFVLLMAELLVYSWCRVQYVQTGYEIDGARKEKQRLVALRYELEVEESRLRSPERIKRLAQQQGLIMPDPKQIVVLP